MASPNRSVEQLARSKRLLSVLFGLLISLGVLVVVETLSLTAVLVHRMNVVYDSTSVEAIRATVKEVGYLYRPADQSAVSGFAISDPLLGWRNRPGALFYSRDAETGKPFRHLKINEYGFVGNTNGDASEGPIDASTFNIIVTGGSSVAGLAATSNETTFPSVLERLLNGKVPAGRHLRARVRVINAGVGGYNSSQELIYLLFDLRYLKPGLVIMFNGINENWYRGSFSGSTDWHHNHHDVLKFERWLERISILPATRVILAKGVRILGDAAAPMPGYKNIRISYRSAPERYRANIEAVAAVANSDGVPFLYVFQPTSGGGGHRFTDEEVRLRQYFVPAKEGVKYESFVKRFYGEFRGTIAVMRDKYQGNPNVVIADGSQIFDDVKESVYYDPRHYNDRGHSIVAEYLYRVIVARFATHIYR